VPRMAQKRRPAPLGTRPSVCQGFLPADVAGLKASVTEVLIALGRAGPRRARGLIPGAARVTVGAAIPRVHRDRCPPHLSVLHVMVLPMLAGCISGSRRNYQDRRHGRGKKKTCHLLDSLDCHFRRSNAPRVRRFALKVGNEAPAKTSVEKLTPPAVSRARMRGPIVRALAGLLSVP
jgi:hypothetical protein